MSKRCMCRRYIRSLHSEERRSYAYHYHEYILGRLAAPWSGDYDLTDAAQRDIRSSLERLHDRPFWSMWPSTLKRRGVA